jgi:hypothetical protein
MATQDGILQAWIGLEGPQEIDGTKSAFVLLRSAAGTRLKFVPHRQQQFSCVCRQTDLVILHVIFQETPKCPCQQRQSHQHELTDESHPPYIRDLARQNQAPSGNSRHGTNGRLGVKTG